MCLRDRTGEWRNSGPLSIACGVPQKVGRRIHVLRLPIISARLRQLAIGRRATLVTDGSHPRTLSLPGRLQGGPHLGKSRLARLVLIIGDGIDVDAHLLTLSG